MASWIDSLKLWARRLKRDVLALWIAARSPKTPMLARLAAGSVAAYAFSPIDLIPDFIPVLGYLDDLVILPLGIALVVRLIPPALMAEFRIEASMRSGLPRSRIAAIVIVVTWMLILLALGSWVASNRR